MNEYCSRGLRARIVKILPIPQRAGRASLFFPKYEVWTNIVPVGSGLRQNIKHEYEVWMNIVPEGYVRSTKKTSIWKIEVGILLSNSSCVEG